MFQTRPTESRTARSRAAAVLAISMFAATAAAQTTTLVYQPGGSGGLVNTLCRSCFIRVSSSELGAAVVENDRLDLGTTSCGTTTFSASRSLVDFPDIIGTGIGRIPPGSTVVSARLKLWCLSAGGSAYAARTVTARYLIDHPERRGTWFEPDSSQSCTVQYEAGASWLARDARPTAQIPWSSAAVQQPLVVTDPAVHAAYPGLEPQITVVPTGQGGYGTNQWHEWEVTMCVQAWTWGLSNQGWLISSSSDGLPVSYASDDHPDPSKRPKLEVTFQPGGTLVNRVPRTLPPTPASPATPQGTEVTITLAAIDDDNHAIELVILNRPAHGVLTGILPYLTYRPEPGFTGQDSFTFAARDFLSISYPRTVTIAVNPDSGTQSTVLQEGVSPTPTSSAAATRSCAARMTQFTGAQNTFEDVIFTVEKDSRQGFLDFANLIGTGASQIPPGARILSARLEMKSAYIVSAGNDRTVSFHRVIDPLDRGGSWTEPGGTAAEPNGCTGCGVTHLWPDSSAPSVAWTIPGGDLSHADVATMEYAATDSGEVWKSADVTAAVQAWADGEPNLGWAIRSASSLASSPTSAVIYESDDAAIPSNRPRLRVDWRAPGAGPGPTGVAPHASAGPDRRAYAHQRVVLDGRGTRHPAGAAFSIAWIQTGGPAVALVPDPQDPPGTPGFRSQIPRFVAPAAPAGPVVLDFLLAAESGGKWSLDTVKVFVAPQPGGSAIPSPLVNAGPDRTVQEITPVIIAATASGGAGPLAFRWTKLSGPAVTIIGASSISPSFQAPPVGPAGADLVLDLEVTDLGAPFAPPLHDQVVVHVGNTPNAAPTSVPGPNRSADVGSWVVLDGTGSFDPESQPLTYTWTQLAGPAVDLSRYVPQGTAASVTTPFQAPSVATATAFTFRLTVSDSEATAQASVTITVEPLLPSFAGTQSLSPYRSVLTPSEARHLRRRLGMGWHPDDVAQTVAATKVQGLGALVDSWVVPANPLAPQYQAIRDEAMNWAPSVVSPTVGPPVFNQPFDAYPAFTHRQVAAHWTIWAFRSPTPIIERMAQFWHDRLACSVRTLSQGKQHWSLLHADMFRFGVPAGGCPTVFSCTPVAGTGPLGNFRTILLRFARDPVTLSFIDGFENVALAPNENFAREFMELHTLGILDESGIPIYSENDVAEAARAFTGWQPACTTAGSGYPSCMTEFVPALHDNGTKIVLGSSPTNFNDQGIVNRVLDYDGGDNASRWLAKGLLETFVTATPSPALIGQLAQNIVSNNWEMQPVLRTLFKSQVMFAATSRKAIVKSPLDLANGAVRTLKVSQQTHDVVGWPSMLSNLMLLGHVLGDPVDVNGWPCDLQWIDEYGTIRRSELARRIVSQGHTPSAPATTTAPGTAYPDQPGHPSAPVDLAKFLPPRYARFSTETLPFLLQALDVDLSPLPGPGAPASEFQLAQQYLDTLPIGAGSPSPCTFSGPFNGECAAHWERLWSLLLLLMEHPDFQRL